MIQALIGPATKLLGKFIEDKDTKNKIAFELSTMAEKHAQQLAMAQIEVNKAEAQSGSIFKGGWRPAVGWICAIAFAYHFIIKDLIMFICGVVSWIIYGYTISSFPILIANIITFTLNIFILISKLYFSKT